MSDFKYIQIGKHLNFKKSKTWSKEVKGKNKAKNGRRFKYADGVFELLALIKCMTGYIIPCMSQGIVQDVLGDDDSPDQYHNISQNKQSRNKAQFRQDTM